MTTIEGLPSIALSWCEILPSSAQGYEGHPSLSPGLRWLIAKDGALGRTQYGFTKPALLLLEAPGL